MRLPAILSLLALGLQEAGTASLPKERKSEELSPEEGGAFAVLHVEDQVLSPDNSSEATDLSSYKKAVEYEDQPAEIKVSNPAVPTRTSSNQSTAAPATTSSNSTTTSPAITSLLGSQNSHGLPTCLLCVCLSSSVYCDEADLQNIPLLPGMTAYLYARFNHISYIQAGDFKGLTKLKRIDLSSNSISRIHNDALRLLPALQDLILTDNQLAALPVLPSSVEFLDVRLNRLQSSGIQPGAFRVLEKLELLHLADNLLDSIPGPFPVSLRSLHLQCPFQPCGLRCACLSFSSWTDKEAVSLQCCLKLKPLGVAQLYCPFQNNMIETLERDAFCDSTEHRHTRRQLEDIRLDSNPINLSLFPDAYFCLPRLPIGRFT